MAEIATRMYLAKLTRMHLTEKGDFKMNREQLISTEQSGPKHERRRVGPASARKAFGFNSPSSSSNLDPTSAPLPTPPHHPKGHVER
jgi:hypothetical protein